MSTTEKKKRGRKKKDQENIKIEIEVKPIQESNTTSEIQPKKRGRKPKGSKILTTNNSSPNDSFVSSNVILHLKCSLQDLKQSKEINEITYDPSVPPEIESFNAEQDSFFSLQENNQLQTVKYAYKSDDNRSLCDNCNRVQKKDTNENANMKTIITKLKQLKLELHKNGLEDKKSACFWCTYEYDNPSCYIPKQEMDYEISGYGSFCGPECAVAYLMNEHIDDSIKFERYNLLNQIYGKIYDYKKNIKPAPNPYYTLDKFYGSISITEYRRLLNSEHLLLTVEKPMTRILPELYEDNDTFSLNVDQNNTNKTVYKVKRNSEQNETSNKNALIQSAFGL